MPDIRQQRAISFGSVADSYVQGRPGYPAAAVSWVLELAPGMRVADLGAGTGKLTQTLVDLGCEVTAVEPLARMREQLERVLPQVPVLDGGAESIPLADSSADALFAAQAFHWFDPIPALAEIARVLAPGGALGLLWNARDDSYPWVQELSQILVVPVDVVSKWDSSDTLPLAQSPLFDRFEERRFENHEMYSPERLLLWAQSTSSIAILDPEAREQRLAQIAELCRTHPDLRGRESFPLPMVTMTTRARRVSES